MPRRLRVVEEEEAEFLERVREDIRRIVARFETEDLYYLARHDAPYRVREVEEFLQRISRPLYSLAELLADWIGFYIEMDTLGYFDESPWREEEGTLYDCRLVVEVALNPHISMVAVVTLEELFPKDELVEKMSYERALEYLDREYRKKLAEHIYNLFDKVVREFTEAYGE